MAQRVSVTALRGGLDLVTAPIEVSPGMLLGGENYEPEARGYVRVMGHERFDGRPSPSEAGYHVLGFRFGSMPLDAGDEVVGSVSGATAFVLEPATPTAGSWGGGDAEGALALGDATGAFRSGEVLRMGGVQVAIAAGPALIAGALSDDDDARFRRLARELRRSRIGKPPGSGPIRGVATFRGDAYCWRDSADGERGQMFKATPSGWEEQTFGRVLRIAAAAAPFSEGEAVTGATSGATATVRRVALRLGAWNGEGKGQLVVTGGSGVFQDGEALSSPSGGAARADGDNATVLPPGGRYVAVEHNFYASESLTRLYVASGVFRAFEWDGEVLAPVLSGLNVADDRPTHVAVHQGHLALGYPNGSLMLSATGEPLSFNALAGAVEIGFGHAITGLLSEARGSLIVAGRNRMGYLTGSSVADFNLAIISEDSGARPYSLAPAAGGPIYLDDRGLRELRATEAFGDWRMGTLTRAVEPWITGKTAAGVAPVGVLRVREKDQVRLVLADGTGLTLYLGRERPEAIPFRLGFGATCLVAGEAEDGSAILLAGAEDGTVHRLDRGVSQDGAPILAFLRLAFDHQGEPGRMKRYHRARLEGRSFGARSRLGIGAEFGYAGEAPAPRARIDVHGSGGFWNDGARWNAGFVWSAPTESQVFADLDGMGENVALIVASESDAEPPHVLSAVSIHHSSRRMVR